ncbi:MAG TPA: DUF4129 domain-containing protein [Flavobacteriales bacterium]|nr:DUF4129 domain-containing protein [Flavobacteriales bacterium]
MNRALLPILALLLGLWVPSGAALAQEDAAADSAAQAGADSIAAAIDEEAEAVAAAEPDLEFSDYGTGHGTWKPYDEWKHVSDDTLAVRAVAFDTAAIAALAQDPDLDYDRTNEVNTLWWSRFLRWLGHHLEKLFGTTGGRAVFQNLHWIILIGVVFFLLYYFRKHVFAGVFGAAPHKARQVREVEEHIERLDLDKLLRQAEKAREWRLALRYHYLKVLRRLVDEGRITWEPRYTDHDYLAQLKEPALRATFSELSFLFKWVWYGDAPVDEQRYHRLRPAFEAFHQHPKAA